MTSTVPPMSLTTTQRYPDCPECGHSYADQVACDGITATYECARQGCDEVIADYPIHAGD